MTVSSGLSAAEPAVKPTPITLSAADQLPAGLRSGDGFSVDDKVLNDGFQNTYTMKTDYGDFTVVGNDALRARIQEIRGTKVLEEIERSDAFKDAMKGAAGGMVEGGKALATAPVETTKSAAKGVGRWLGNVGRSVSSKDPYQENVVKTALGHDAVKRGYALEMGVDPYTDFEPFQKRLGEVARAATAGGLVVMVGSDMATQGGTLAGTLVTVTSLAAMKDFLLDEPPSTLARINAQKLEEMGIGATAAKALLKNYNYTPTEMTLMVEALRRMGDIKGREIFVSYATAAPDRMIARYMQQNAEMVANYVTETEKGDIVDAGGEPWLLTRSGKLVGALPTDYVAWTAEIDGAERVVSARAEELGAKDRLLLLERGASKDVLEALRGRGWTVKDNVHMVFRAAK